MQNVLKNPRAKKKPHLQKRVLDMIEAAEYCGYTTRTFNDYFRAGMIPGGSKPTGRKVFFDREILDQWLLGNPIKTKKELESKAALYVTKKH